MWLKLRLQTFACIQLSLVCQNITGTIALCATFSTEPCVDSNITPVFLPVCSTVTCFRRCLGLLSEKCLLYIQGICQWNISIFSTWLKSNFLHIFGVSETRLTSHVSDDNLGIPKYSSAKSRKCNWAYGNGCECS